MHSDAQAQQNWNRIYLACWQSLNIGGDPPFLTPAFVQRSADDEDMAAARREYDARMTVLQPEAAGQEVRDFGTVDRLYWDSGGHEAGYKHPYSPLILALLKRP